MKKLLLIPPLLALGCFFAGAYGIIHDQLTYTVSPDYFHAFKFYQFQISPHLQDRLGAAIVGWQATWWMGPLIGIPLLVGGLLTPGWQGYLKQTLAAYGVAAATALVVGVATLAIASMTINESNLPSFAYPEGVIDKAAFARVGLMHNFSYAGGFLGIVTGLIYLAWSRWKALRVPRQQA